MGEPQIQEKRQELWGHFHWLGVLAQQGSYTAAAARLGVSKAAVSQRVAELERLAGVALVQRTTRSVRLTEAGQRLVDDTRSSFEHMAQCFAQVRDAAGAPRGLLRVTAQGSGMVVNDGQRRGVRVPAQLLRRLLRDHALVDRALGLLPDGSLQGNPEVGGG